MSDLLISLLLCMWQPYLSLHPIWYSKILTTSYEYWIPFFNFLTFSAMAITQRPTLLSCKWFLCLLLHQKSEWKRKYKHLLPQEFVLLPQQETSFQQLCTWNLLSALSFIMSPSTPYINLNLCFELCNQPSTSWIATTYTKLLSLCWSLPTFAFVREEFAWNSHPALVMLFLPVHQTHSSVTPLIDRTSAPLSSQMSSDWRFQSLSYDSN